MPFALLSALLFAAHAAPMQVCPALEEALPPALAAWANPAPAGRTLGPGRAARVALGPFASGIAATPGHNEGSNARSRRIGFDVNAAGTYRIAFDAFARIAVVRHGRKPSPAARANGPSCTGILEIVDFELQPGHYELRIDDTRAETVLVLILSA